MQVLVDTSAWIEYFRKGNDSDKLDHLIDNNLLVINDLILAELSPVLKIRKQKKLLNLLYAIKRLDLNIVWEKIIEHQYKCLKKGINGVGIPDLIIVQNALQNKCLIYSLDKHFNAIKKITGIGLM